MEVKFVSFAMCNPARLSTLWLVKDQICTWSEKATRALLIFIGDIFVLCTWIQISKDLSTLKLPCRLLLNELIFYHRNMLASRNISFGFPLFFEFINENLFISLLTVGSSRWNNPQWVIYLMNFASLFSAAHELPQIYEF